MNYVYMDRENGIEVVQEEHTIKLVVRENKAHLTIKETRSVIAALLVATDALEESKSKGGRI